MARANDPPDPRCPICDAVVERRGANPSFPFCNARCKTIDLGKWLNEEYRVPVERDDDELADEDEHGGASSDTADSKTRVDMRH